MTAAPVLETEKMLYDVRDGIGWVTFNQPEKRNAIALEMWQALGDIMTYFQESDEVRLAVMKGAGDKAFVSGADISEFDSKRATAEQRRSYAEISARGSRSLEVFDKPLIAMIQGFCIGGGLATALSADIRFASDDSTFGIPAARLGLGYEYGGLARLTSLVGHANARDIMFSARYMDAEEAHRMGLVNFVTTRDSLEGEVLAYAERIAANAPLTIRAAKAGLNAAIQPESARDTDAVRALVDACFDSEDYKEGRKAFAAKRPPEFRGR